MGITLTILQSVGTTPDERDKLIINVKGFAMTPAASLKARLHRRLLSRQLDAIFVALSYIKFQTCSKALRYRGDKLH